MVTIARTNWIDDDGSGTTGTVINNAVKTDLYNQIDAALALVAQLSGGNTFAGVQSVTNLNVGSLAAALVIAAAPVQFNIGPTAPVVFNAPGEAANNRLWDIIPSALSLDFRAVTDGYAGAAYWMKVGRVTGTGNIATVNFPSGTFQVGGPAVKFSVDTASGLCSINQAVNYLNSKLAIASDVNGLSIQNTIVSLPALVGFLNSAGASCGSIAMASQTTVAYNTTSDARLKIDRGRATDLSALRAVVVHDYTWKADGIDDRGIFAQDAQVFYPHAVTPGDDAVTDSGTLAHPWMTDYSKFVADLIVGWQQHDAELERLRAALAAMKGLQ